MWYTVLTSAKQYILAPLGLSSVVQNKSTTGVTYMLENSSLPYASVVLAAGVHAHCSEVHKLYATVTSGCCVTCCFLCWSPWLACLPCPHVHGCCYRSLKATSSLYACLSWRFTMKNWLIYSALTIPPN